MDDHEVRCWICQDCGNQRRSSDSAARIHGKASDFWNTAAVLLVELDRRGWGAQAP